MNESQVGKDDKLEVNRRFKNNEKDVVDKFNNKSKDKSNNNKYNKNRAHQANFMTKP